MCHGQNMTIGPPQWELFTSCISSCLPNLNLDVQFVTENTCFIISSLSMDWFKGQFAGKSHISWENNSGFRRRFSQQNQSMKTFWSEVIPPQAAPSQEPNPLDLRRSRLSPRAPWRCSTFCTTPRWGVIWYPLVGGWPGPWWIWKKREPNIEQ